jgi:outer membrane protein assembly factor BamB
LTPSSAAAPATSRWAWPALGLLLAGAGWRGDGTGVTAAATPTSWTREAGVAWTAPLPAWSNSSPVIAAHLVCTRAEPDQVLCLERATGRVAWTATLRLTDALPASERAAAAAALADATRTRAEIATLTAEVGRLRRAASAGDAAARVALDAAVSRMATLRAALDAVDPRWIAQPDSLVGWTTPSLATDGARLFAVQSDGLVAAFDLAGRRLWLRDLGPQREAIRVFNGAPTASPTLAGGRLIVAWDRLLALDPATGATAWDAGPYRDFGTPAVTTVGGQALIATPDGRLLDARDGRVVQSGLGDVLFVGPYAAGERLYYVGNGPEGGGGGAVTARAWALSAAGGAISAKPLWSVTLPLTGRMYASPALWGSELVVAGRAGELLLLDAASGRITAQTRAPLTSGSEVWPSPLVAGGRLYLTSDQGQTLVYDRADLAAPRSNLTGRGLATPVAADGRLFIRTREAMWAIGR